MANLEAPFPHTKPWYQDVRSGAGLLARPHFDWRFKVRKQEPPSCRSECEWKLYCVPLSPIQLDMSDSLNPLISMMTIVKSSNSDCSEKS